MTGYIRPETGELKVSDYEYYKAAYCGLCRRMGKICGGSSRITLSYDMVFLYFTRLALMNESPDIKKRSCPYNPVLRKNMAENSEQLDYAACVSVILSGYKFLDGAADEKGLKRAGCRLGSGISKRWIKKADRRYPGLEEGIKSRLSAFYEAEGRCREEKSSSSPDICAGLFGDLLGFVFSYGLPADSHLVSVAAAIGRHTGRWIYCIDALDDIKEDEKRGRFNPYLLLYGRSVLEEEEKVTMDCLLGAEAGAAYDALDLIPDEDCPAPVRICGNILTRGMPMTAKRVLDGTYRQPGRENI